MGIGAIMAYQPYIYNTNTVSAKSLEKIQGVNNDVSTDHIEKKSPSVADVENSLSYGETSDFASVLDEQMHMGMQNAMRLFGSDSVYAANVTD